MVKEWFGYRTRSKQDAEDVMGAIDVILEHLTA